MQNMTMTGMQSNTQMPGQMNAQSASQMTPNHNMWSDKELHYVKDFMSWELLAMKKCNEAASLCQNPQIKQAIRQVGQKHQQHFETLLSQLQS